MSSLVALNRNAPAAFDALVAAGVQEPLRPATPFLAAFRREADSVTLREELAHINASGQDIDFEVLTGDRARLIASTLSGEIAVAIQIRGQRYIDPGAFTRSLADSVRDRGGQIVTNREVVDVTGSSKGVVVVTDDGERRPADAAVLACGAWIGSLARRHGVRALVQAGRGYSFSVPVDHRPARPIYFPVQRVACTPLGDRLRVAGMMSSADPTPRWTRVG